MMQGLKGAARAAAQENHVWNVSHVLVWRNDVVITAVVAMVGALVLAMPIAHAYRLSKRHRDYDAAVTETILILPAVVAGIVMVVQGSLALAFSLVGVAATVRFRSNLKDTNDAMFIFFAIALGIAAGVQGLDLALAMCVVFYVTVVAISSSRYGSLRASHEAHATAIATKSAGDAPALVDIPAGNGAPTFAARPFEGHGAHDGIIAVRGVHAERAAAARPALEARLAEHAKSWELTNVVSEMDGVSTLEYQVHFKKKADPQTLLDSLSETARPYGVTVEYWGRNNVAEDQSAARP